MKSMKNPKRHNGFFAVGLGLALTALFGLTAVTISGDEQAQPIVEQADTKVPDLVYKDNDR